MRPHNESIINSAVDYAIKQAGKKYNIRMIDKDDESAFYCTQLVWKSIDADRPVILSICSSGWGVVDHYVVGEKADYRYWQNNTSDITEIGIYVNWGWGGSKNKWIYPYYDALTGHSASFTSTYDIWTINIF